MHPAIHRLLIQNGVTMDDLDAVAVNAGPGSYTGLRVGMSAAKGLCFVSGKPLIVVNSLDLLAHAMLRWAGSEQRTGYRVPLIDARRMEVFTAVYPPDGSSAEGPRAMILDSASFEELLRHTTVMFAGSGAAKFRELVHHPNALFSDQRATAADMIEMTDTLFQRRQFSDLAYTEPFYVKEFFQPNR